ncbi:MAG: aminoglycoside phosphotransferase family protein [Candidatus Omnitrophota bacterium]
MIQSLEKHLRKNWSNFFPNRAPPNNFYFILKRRLNRYQIFIFDERSKAPFCIMKTPLDQKKEWNVNEINLKFINNDKLFKNEIEVLNLINGTEIGDLRKTIPRVVFSGKLSDKLILIESALPGKNMINYTRVKTALLWKKTLENQADLVLKWLIDFHKRVSQSQVGLSGYDTKEIISSRKDPLGCALKDSWARKRYDEILGDVLAPDFGRKIPRVIVHGDFRVDNFLIDNNKLGVLDWERAFCSRFGLFDIFSYWARQGYLVYDPAARENAKDPFMTYSSFKATFFKHTGISGLVAHSIERYAETFNIKSNDVRAIFLLWLIEFWDTFELVEIFLKKENDFII